MNDVTVAPNVAVSETKSPSAIRVPAYILIVLGAVLAASYYRLRTDSIFGCQATGYSAEQYLSYCQTEGYGDFDHGAFWFNLEPEATRAATAAQVLFVGNSRMQYGFSTTAAQEWLSRNASSYYLLGFAYHPQVLFHRALLHKLDPRPQVYVINLDTFFEEKASVPARIVMNEPDARSRYRRKQIWQAMHRAVCGWATALCGNSYAIFKVRSTGVWQSSGAISANEAASLDPKVDADMVAREIVSGQKFLDALGVDRRCVIFTLVPTVDTPNATSAAIAAALHVDYIAPELEDLLTFDGSHLDLPSAERWSGAFFDAAGPRIRECLKAGATRTTAAAAAN
jgi:hypothetical protein